MFYLLNSKLHIRQWLVPIFKPLFLQPLKHTTQKRNRNANHYPPPFLTNNNNLCKNNNKKKPLGTDKEEAYEADVNSRVWFSAFSSKKLRLFNGLGFLMSIAFLAPENF